MDDCCEKNRSVVKTTENDTGIMIIEQCNVCKKKHYRLKAKPISIGMKGTAFGK